MRFGSAIAAFALMAAADAAAQSLDFSGDLSLQGRWYPQSPAFPGQRSGTGGLVVEPTLYREVGPAASLTFTPLYRYDSADSERTHGDLREAYVLMYGDWGENAWELRLGLDRVFWGVAELHNLVDVVNQLDLVEHPRDRPKLGQPMAHLTISGSWGVAETFLLPYHRKRTYPGPSGRLRSGRLIEKTAAYESGARKSATWTSAARYSHAVGLLDFGLSAFVGTSREPFFLVSHQSGGLPAADAPLIPLLRADPADRGRRPAHDRVPCCTRWKPFTVAARAISWARKRTTGAFIFGLERALYGLFGSQADLTLLAEWLYDSRGRRATSVWANDLFIAGFLAFNDVEGTELVAGVLGDLDHDYRALNLELKRRLSDSWSMRLEAIVTLASDPEDLTYDGRRDSFLGVDFTYSF